MINRTFSRLFLLCLLVNAISGSVPRFDSRYPIERQTRHASCPSCCREQPDALVSWSMPIRGEEQDLETKPDTWQTNGPFNPNPFFNRSPYTNPYNRASRSRGTPALDRSEQSGERENPFTIGRDLNFDVAPAQSPPLYSVTVPENPYHPRSPTSRSTARSSFINPSFYDMIEHQSDIKSPNGHFNPHLSHPAPYEDFKDTGTMYRAKKYHDDTSDEKTPIVPAVQYPKRTIPYRDVPTGVQMRGTEEFSPDRREESEESHVIYEPQIKYNAYKPPADTSAFGMFPSISKHAPNNTNWWQQRFQERRKEEMKNNSFMQKENNSRMKVKMTMEMNDGGQSEDHYHSHEREREEEAKNKRNTMRGSNSSRDKTPGETSTQSEFPEDIEPVRQLAPVYVARSTTEPPMMA